MQALLESGDLAPTSEEAALRFVDDELAAFTTNPQLAQALVEGGCCWSGSSQEIR